MAAARTAPRIAAGSGERLVQIWDVDAAKLICEIDTVLDVGGRRLALSPNGELCVAASWRKGKRAGIAGYDANTGAEVWHRSDITHTQTLYFSTLDGRIWCEIQDAPALCLDPTTGATLETLRAIVKVRDGGSRRQRLCEQRNQKGFLLLTGQSRQLIPPLSFGMLDAAFSPETFCLSEAGKPARLFDCASGTEIWRYGRDLWHFVRIWYQPANDLFYAVEPWIPRSWTAHRAVSCRWWGTRRNQAD